MPYLLPENIRELLDIYPLVGEGYSTSLKSKLKCLQKDPRRRGAVTLFSQQTSPHSFFNRREHTVIYPSKEGEGVALNGQVVDYFGEKVVCRHLAMSAAEPPALKGYHQRLGSVEAIRSVNALFWAEYGLRYLESTYMHFTDSSGFGPFLAKVAAALNPSEETSFFLLTENHAMLLTAACKPISKKKCQYVFKFYDPNFTDCHRRVICESVSMVRNLRIKDLIHPDYYSQYFRKEEGLSFLGTKRRDDFIHPVIGFSGRAVRYALYLLIVYGYSHSKSNFSWPELGIPLTAATESVVGTIVRRCFTQGYTDDEILDVFGWATQYSAFYFAMLDGRRSTVSACLQAILSSSISRQLKVSLLQSPADDGSLALEIALFRQKNNCVSVFVSEVANSSLCLLDKVDLLSISDDALTYLLSKHLEGSVRTYLKALCNSSLRTIDQLFVLRLSNLFNIGKALSTGDAPLIRAMIRPVLNAHFSELQLKRLLTIDREYLVEQGIDLSVYDTLIRETDKLSDATKLELLPQAPAASWGCPLM